MRIKQNETIGIIIDIQKKLFAYIDGKERLLNKTILLLSGLRLFDVPMIVTYQYKKGLGEIVEGLGEFITGNPEIEKFSFSCMGDDEFVKVLEASGKKTIIVAGIESHICVLQTVLDMIEKGYTVFVVEDCVASRSDKDKMTALERIRHAGGVVTSCESVLYELCGTAENDKFKSLQKLVKDQNV